MLVAPNTSAEAARLSATEVAQYHADGQLTPSLSLPALLMQRMTRSIEILISNNPGVRSEQLVGAHVTESRDSGVRGEEALLACARHPFILDIVEQLIGTEIIVWGSQVFSKPAGDGMAVPWHQDGQYWPLRPMRSVTVWVAIDEATVENGCMRVIHGTHRCGLLTHEFSDADGLALNQQITAGEYNAAAAIDVQLKPGQFSVHDAMIVHGSNANTSGKRRCGYAVRYMPATALFDRTVPPTRLARNQVIDFSQRPIWLVRGEDRAGNDFDIGH